MPRKYGKAAKKCSRCGDHSAMISRYGLNLCRQCFREIAPKIGFPPLPGKGFRGGKQSVRDSNIKSFPKEFQRWFHKYYKEKGDLDSTIDEFNNLYKEWIKMGQPKVK